MSFVRKFRSFILQILLLHRFPRRETADSMDPKPDVVKALQKCIPLFPSTTDSRRSQQHRIEPGSNFDEMPRYLGTRSVVNCRDMNLFYSWSLVQAICPHGEVISFRKFQVLFQCKTIISSFVNRRQHQSNLPVAYVTLRIHIRQDVLFGW